MITSFLLASGISIGSALLCYYRVSRKTYNGLEEAYGETIDNLSKPEREKFLIQKMIDVNRAGWLQPSFTDFRFGGYKLFAEKHGIDLGALLKPNTLQMKIQEYGIVLKN